MAEADRRRIETAAVVLDRQLDASAAAGEPDPDFACSGVLVNIGERLLSDAIQRQRGVAGQVDRFVEFAAQLAGKPFAVRHQQLLQRRPESEVSQQCRVQILDQTALQADAIAEQLAKGLQPTRNLGVLAGPLRAQPGHVQPGCCQDGAEFVVQFTGERGPFGLAGMLQPGGQITGHAVVTDDGVCGGRWGGAGGCCPRWADPRSADAAGRSRKKAWNGHGVCLNVAVDPTVRAAKTCQQIRCPWRTTQ